MSKTMSAVDMARAEDSLDMWTHNLLRYRTRMIQYNLELSEFVLIVAAHLASLFPSDISAPLWLVSGVNEGASRAES
jgi:hypothetical protein